MESKWRKSTWGEEISLEYGKRLQGYKDGIGRYRVYGSNGPVGWTNKSLAPGPGVILGRKGANRGVEYSKEPFFVIDTAYYVKPKTKLDMRWLYYAIKHYDLGEINDGSPIPSTTRAAVYVSKFQVPDITEQKAIAHILGSLDDKIELNRRMNKTLEAMAQALFTSWFVDFDPVIDNALAAGNEIPEELKEKAEIRKALGNARKPLPEEIRNLFPSEFEYTEEMGPACSRQRSEGRWIPKGWRVDTFDSLITFIVDNRGKTPPLSTTSGTVYPLVEVNALKGGNRFFDKHSIRKYVDQDTYNSWFRKGHPCEGDVMLSTVGSIAEVCLVGDEECCVAQNIISLRGATSLSGLYLYELIKHYRNSLINLDISSVQPSIKVPHLMSLKVLDGHNLHDKFGELAIGYSERYKNNQKQLMSLSNLRDTLLPKLLSGEIRISEAEKLVREASEMNYDSK